jgi:hypothetical protein
MGEMSFVSYDDSHPLVQWALETRKKLEKCRK